MSNAIVDRPCPNAECAMWGKVGTELRTPAMQAELVAKRLIFRNVFTGAAVFFLLVALAIRFRDPYEGLIPRSVLA